jgi:hypothetical protein
MSAPPSRSASHRRCHLGGATAAAGSSIEGLAAFLDKCRVEVGQSELPGPEHVERVILREGSPAEPERPLAPRSVHERTAQVELAVVVAFHGNVKAPAD